MKIISALIANLFLGVTVCAQPRTLPKTPEEAMERKVNLWKKRNPPEVGKERAQTIQRLTRERGELVCENGIAGGIFSCDNVNLAAFLSGEDLGTKEDFTWTNEVWGYVDSKGREYAIVGLYDGVSFVDVSNPIKPKVLGFLPGTQGSFGYRGYGSFWRDLKVVGDVLYVSADQQVGFGIQVYDLNRLKTMHRGLAGPVPVIEPDYVVEEGHFSHNLVVAPSNNILYAASAEKLIAVGINGKDPDCPRNSLGHLAAMKIFDISENPLEPKFEECLYLDQEGRNENYSHDAHCVSYHGPDVRYEGQNICALFASFGGFIIIYNLDTREILQKLTYEGAAIPHQGHFSDDHAFLYTNDEYDEYLGFRPNGNNLIWSLESLSGPVPYLRRYEFDFGFNVTAAEHNMLLKDGRAYQAAYQAGARILEVTEGGGFFKEIGFFKVKNGECDYVGDCMFDGTWSHYPMPSGITLANSITDGLFILRPTLD